MKITDSSTRTLRINRRRVRIAAAAATAISTLVHAAESIIPSDASRRGMAGEILQPDRRLRPRRKTSRAKWPRSRRSSPSARPTTSPASAGGRPAARSTAGTRSSSTRCRMAFVTVPLAAPSSCAFPCRIGRCVVGCAVPQQIQRASSSRSQSMLQSRSRTSATASSASEHAAVAAAAADVLGYLFPARAAYFSTKAEEAMQSRLLAGVELPHEVAAGRAIGQGVAALAIARGKADRSDIEVERQRAGRSGQLEGGQSDRAAGGKLATLVARDAERIPAVRTSSVRLRSGQDGLDRTEDLSADAEIQSSCNLLGGPRRSARAHAVERDRAQPSFSSTALRL